MPGCPSRTVLLVPVQAWHTRTHGMLHAPFFIQSGLTSLFKTYVQRTVGGRSQEAELEFLAGTVAEVNRVIRIIRLIGSTRTYKK
jgi:hypothetical protein